jgi:hypothetical protein
MSNESRLDDYFGVIAVIVLLIGAATGNAFVLLGMSVAALVLMMVFARKRLGRGALLTALVAAVTGAVIAIILTLR